MSANDHVHPPARRRPLWPWYLVVAVLLGLAAGALLLPDQVSKTLGVALPWSCQGQARDYQVALQPHLEKWQDTLEVAGSTSRIALGPQVEQLQEVRRDALAIEAPSCAAQPRQSMDKAMEAGIDAFLGFMRQDNEVLVANKFDQASDLYVQFSAELTALTGGAATEPQALPTPRPTSVPRPTATPEDPRLPALAWDACFRFTKQELEPFEHQEYGVDPPEQSVIKNEGNGRFQVQLNMSALNKYADIDRYRPICVVQHQSDNTWDLVSLNTNFQP